MKTLTNRPWKEKLNMKDVWTTSSPPTQKELHDICKAFGKRLRKLKQFDDELEEIANYFDELSTLEEIEVDEFDCVLEDLYNWADIDKRLWVGTII